MPIYEIECSDCGQRSEVLVPSDDSARPCPQCGGERTKKLISAPSQLTGRTPQGLPGPADHSCCGSRPAEAGCAGPGSCCGKAGPS